MNREELIVRELEEAGLEVTKDVGDNVRGVLVACDAWSRGYVYPGKNGDHWGWVSEDILISDLTADEIVKCVPGITRGTHEDEPVLGAKPAFVINRRSKDALWTFVRLVRVLTTVDPAIVERWSRRTA